MTNPDFFAIVIGALGAVIFSFPLTNGTMVLLGLIFNFPSFRFLLFLVGVRCAEVPDLEEPVVQMKSMLLSSPLGRQ